MGEPARENKMGIMPINRLLLNMALPMIASMLVQALYNVVDSVFVAKLSEDALNQRIVELKTQHDDALAVVKDLDARMVSLKELRGHLVVYRQYKPLAQKLQTVRNPAKFKEQHRAEFAVYEAACAYFKANGLRTLPDLKKLDAEYQTLSSEKNGFYTRYKKAQIELRELRTAQQNVEAFFRKEERSHAVPQQEVK